MKRLVRYGEKNVLGRRLKQRRMVSIMEMFHHLKEEEHVSFWGITKFGNPLLFYSKNLNVSYHSHEKKDEDRK